MTPLFRQDRNLSDLQEEDERLSVEESVERKKAAIRRLKASGVDWKLFSSNGTIAGFDLKRAWAWLKSH